MKLLPILQQLLNESAYRDSDFWITDNGKAIKVPFEGHAEYIFKNSEKLFGKKLQGEDGMHGDAYDLAFGKGWIKLSFISFDSDKEAYINYGKDFSRPAMVAALDKVMDVVNVLYQLSIENGYGGDTDRYKMFDEDDRETFFKDYGRYLK